MMLPGIDIDLIGDLCHSSCDQFGSEFDKVIASGWQVIVIHPEKRCRKFLRRRDAAAIFQHTSSWDVDLFV